MRHLCFTETNAKISLEIIYKGTLYKKGQFLLTRSDDLVEFGELTLILIKDETVVHFLMSTTFMR